jgi:hypothetical protein
LFRSLHSYYFVPTPVLLADYSGMRMGGTSCVGKAAADAEDIMGESASGVKYFFHSDKQIGQIRKSISRKFDPGLPRGGLRTQKLPI